MCVYQKTNTAHTKISFGNSSRRKKTSRPPIVWPTPNLDLPVPPAEVSDILKKREAKKYHSGLQDTVRLLRIGTVNVDPMKGLEDRNPLSSVRKM